MSKSSVNSNESIDSISTPEKNKKEFQTFENVINKMSDSFENSNKMSNSFENNLS